MSYDYETTSPEAAAQYEADRTPYYDERLDEYEPDHGYVHHSPPIATLTAMFGVMTRAIRCAHPHCRISLDDKRWVQCPHDAFFCENCAWEEACDECAGAA